MMPVSFEILSSLPRGSTGKVDRVKLRGELSRAS